MLSINLKFKKPFKKQLKSTKTSRNNVTAKYGFYVLKAAESGVITEKQIEAARRVVSRITKRRCRLWILTPANKPITAKPNEVRMGKGKGAVNTYVRYITAGEVLFEVNYGIPHLAKAALSSAGKKLPILTRVI